MIKGGATEAGVKVIKLRRPSIFEELFEKTLERQRERKKRKVDEQFNKLNPAEIVHLLKS